MFKCTYPVDNLKQVEYNCENLHYQIDAFEWNSVSDLQGNEYKVVKGQDSYDSFDKL